MTGRRGIGARQLVLVLALLALVSFAIWEWRRREGSLVPPTPWVAIGLLVALAALVVSAAWPVRTQLTVRRSARFDPLRAARTLVLAQASALTGAGALGWYAGQLLVALRDVDLTPVRSSIVRIVLAALASVVLMAAGLWAQSMCRLDDDRDQPHDPARDQPDPPPRRDSAQ